MLSLDEIKALKTLGYINKFNFGIATAKKYLKDNGNPKPEFDLSLLTALKVTIPISNHWKHL